jgi:hypothetical protein
VAPRYFFVILGSGTPASPVGRSSFTTPALGLLSPGPTEPWHRPHLVHPACSFLYVAWVPVCVHCRVASATGNRMGSFADLAPSWHRGCSSPNLLGDVLSVGLLEPILKRHIAHSAPIAVHRVAICSWSLASITVAVGTVAPLHASISSAMSLYKNSKRAPLCRPAGGCEQGTACISKAAKASP